MGGKLGRTVIAMPSTMNTVASMTLGKCLSIVFNTIFWCTGVAMLVLGIWMDVDLHKYMKISGYFSEIAPTIFLAVGGVIVVVGLCACCCTLGGNAIALYLVHCCGLDSYTDWYVTPFSDGEKIVPKSCCADAGKCDVSNIQDLNQLGCFHKVMSSFTADIAWVALVAIIVVSFQLFGVILTCCLARVIQKSHL